MKEPDFYCGKRPFKSRPQEGAFLFHDFRHLKLQSLRGWRFYALHQGEETLAQIAFCIKENAALSPYRAPFGSLVIDESVRRSQLVDFIAKVKSDLKDLGVKKVVIKHYPETYLPLTQAMVREAFADQGFRIVNKSITSIIQVNRPYVEKIAISERQKLRRSSSLFSFEPVPLSLFDKTYRFIERCRKQKNQTLSITLAKLRKVVKVFPHHFFLFKVANASECAAMAITILIRKDILYTFYYAHNSKFNKVSPVVQLIDGIYSFALEKNIKMIDLGTSMTKTGINKSLLKFKQNIGGVQSFKLEFEARLL